ncbi:hypothetical protein D3C75_1266510 [compost metagenome]
MIKYRILNRDNENNYTDWETSVEMNSLIRGRNKLPNEYRIINSSSDVETTFQEILKVLEKHVPSRTNKIDVREDDFYSYITT